MLRAVTEQSENIKGCFYAHWEAFSKYLIGWGLTQQVKIIFKLSLKKLKRAIILENVISKENLIFNLIYVQFEVFQWVPLVTILSENMP